MRLKIVVGLGNPGPEHDATRHNVGWWVVDRLAYDWGFRAFEKKDDSLVSEGDVVGSSVQLVKPLTYMNRSGLSLKHLINLESFRVKEDLLVIVDDAALEVGRVRFRAEGGPGGHNGLKSVSGFLQSVPVKFSIESGIPSPSVSCGFISSDGTFSGFVPSKYSCRSPTPPLSVSKINGSVVYESVPPLRTPT